MQNGVRTLRARPVKDDIVRDGQGHRYRVNSVGMRYAKVQSLNTGLEHFVNLRDVYPDSAPPIVYPSSPVPQQSVASEFE